MPRLPSAARGSRSRAAGQEPAARSLPCAVAGSELDSDDAEELLVSVGFLLVPGPPFDRGPSYLLVAVRPKPTLAHFDPERIEFWADTDKGPVETILEWPLQRPVPDYKWGSIEVVDRLGKSNRFVSFGGAVSVARDHDVHAVLFRSDAPILSAGGQSGPPDPLGTNIGAFFGVLRAEAGNDAQIGDVIRHSSPVALYAAFLTRSLAIHRAAQIASPGGSRLTSLLRQEICRLERAAADDLRQGQSLVALMSPVPNPGARR